jgi:hypothetical protein
MTPLRDSDSQSPISQKSRELLATMPPIDPTPEQIQRIRHSLLSHRSISPRFSVKWAVIAAMVLLCAVAGATWSSSLWVSSHPVSIASTVSSVEKNLAKNMVISSASVALSPATLESSASTLASVASTSPAQTSSLNSRRTEANAQIDAVGIVHEAAIALRRDHNPSRAAQLLAKLGNGIRGPLAEEALALQVEAAVADKDPQARNFARSYLRTYPSGRYADLAKKALEGQ